MKILFLDDDPERHRQFLAATAGMDVTAVTTIAEAIEAINATPFNIAFLDHDLDGMQMVTPGPNTGLAVAEHIATMPMSKAPLMVVLHSYNDEGRAAMRKALRWGPRCVDAPFGDSMFSSMIQHCRNRPATR